MKDGIKKKKNIPRLRVDYGTNTSTHFGSGTSGLWTRKSLTKSCIAARGEEGEKGVPVEPGVGQADQEGHRQQEPLGPGQGDRGLHQKGVPRQGKQISSVGDP